MALDRDAHRGLPAREPSPDGDGVSRGRAGGHGVGHWRAAREGRRVVLRDARAARGRPSPRRRPGPARRDRLRGVRPGRRPRRRPRLGPRAQRRLGGAAAPRDRRRDRGGPGRLAARAGGREGALGRPRAREPPPRRRVRPRERRPRHAVRRGDASHARGAIVVVPHVRPVPREGARLRVGRPVHADGAVALRDDEPRRHEVAPRGPRPRDAGAAGAQGLGLGQPDRRERPLEGPHDLSREPLVADPRRVRPGARGRGRADDRRRAGGSLARGSARRVRGARPRGPAARARLLRRPRVAARARLRRLPGGLGGLAALPPGVLARRGRDAARPRGVRRHVARGRGRRRARRDGRRPRPGARRRARAGDRRRRGRGSGRRTRRQAVRAWVQSAPRPRRVRRRRDAARVDDLLADGRPVEGAAVSLSGRARRRAPTRRGSRGSRSPTSAPLVVARLGRDVAILPSSSGWWSEGQGFRRSAYHDTLRWFVFDDRKTYKPGEEARLKGWVRRVGSGPSGDVRSAPEALDRVTWTLRDSRGNEIGKGEARLSPAGAFDLSLKLPPTVNLGTTAVALEARGAAIDGASYQHTIEVQEFRRPEFEVKAQASEGPHVASGHATVTVSAAYYAGGALPGADVIWRVTSRPAQFRPPNRDGFTFGSFVPWWRPWPGAAGPEESAAFAGRTDAAGAHRLRIDFDPRAKPRPRQLEAEATVMDVNRQAWSARSTLLVHPALEYVGLRAQEPFVRKGEDLALDVIVTDLDGRAVPGRRVSLRAERLDWEQVAGEWKEVPKDAQEQSVESGAEPVRVRFAAREGGSWRVVARARDEAGRANETEMPLWVAGGRVPPRRDLQEEEVTIVPDRREYRGGDVARLLVVAPFAPAEALLTLRRSGLVREQRFRIDEASREIEVPIEEGFTPNVHVSVALVGAAPRAAARDGAPGRPAFASGSVDLPVPPRERTLAVDAKPREAALEPGGATTIDVAVRDAAGRPAANAEATVVVVDEAVLALGGYERPDPLAVFYARREDGVGDYRLRRDVLLASPEDLAEQMQQPGAAGGAVRAEGLTMLDAAAAMPQSMPAPAPMARMAKMAFAGAAPQPIRARTDFSMTSPSSRRRCRPTPRAGPACP
ncbi:MAG: MG2 domain-containing protein [Vicinamibacteria bacterium]